MATEVRYPDGSEAEGRVPWYAWLTLVIAIAVILGAAIWSAEQIVHNGLGIVYYRGCLV